YEIYIKYGFSSYTILRGNYKFILILLSSMLVFSMIYLIYRKLGIKEVVWKQTDKSKLFNIFMLAFISLIIGTILFLVFVL
ncbi:MAG: hypothetical protein IJZ26_04020, partial [Clostridia bacterium]|nr:hypothetical protein [Clostridia bacterium]